MLKDLYLRARNGVKSDDRERYLRLFLYVTEQGLRSIIREKKIRLSCPWRTNDMTEGVAQGEQTQSERMRAYGYVCFSAVCDSPAMWGYYADRGQGACLVFDFPISPTDGGPRRKAKDFYILHHGLLPPKAKVVHQIRYRKDRLPSSDFGDDTQLLLTKSPDWRHEKEYRILYRLSSVTDSLSYLDSPTGRTEYYDAELLKFLSGIILGPKCCLNIEEVRTELTHSCQAASITSEPLPFIEEETPKDVAYAVSLALAKAQIIRAVLDRKSFAYRVAVAEIVTRKPSYADRLLFRIFRCAHWWYHRYRREMRFCSHYPWLMAEVYRAEDWKPFGNFVEAAVAICREADSHESTHTCIYLERSDGERFVIPSVPQEVLSAILQKAVQGSAKGRLNS